MTNTTNPATLCFDAVNDQTMRYALAREKSMQDPAVLNFRLDRTGEVMSGLANGMTPDAAIAFMTKYADVVVSHYKGISWEAAEARGVLAAKAGAAMNA